MALRAGESVLGHANVVWAAGFSGNDFKFVFMPATGAVLAEMPIDGRTGSPVEFLGVSRFAAAGRSAAQDFSVSVAVADSGVAYRCSRVGGIVEAPFDAWRVATVWKIRMLPSRNAKLTPAR